MKFFRSCFMLFLLPAVIIATNCSCSSDSSNGESTEFNILVLDVDTGEPIQGALIEVCNSPYFCSNILASGTTGGDGKIKLTLSDSNMSIARGFTVYKNNYFNETVLIEGLDLNKEIIVRIRNIEG